MNISYHARTKHMTSHLRLHRRRVEGAVQLAEFNKIDNMTRGIETEGSMFTIDQIRPKDSNSITVIIRLRGGGGGAYSKLDLQERELIRGGEGLFKSQLTCSKMNW